MLRRVHMEGRKETALSSDKHRPDVKEDRWQREHEKGQKQIFRKRKGSGAICKRLLV